MEPIESSATSSTPRVSLGPWGPWLTLIFGAVIMVLYSTFQAIALLPLLVAAAIHGMSPNELPQLALTGFNLAIATITACPVMLAACGLMAWARQGPSLKEYLALHTSRPWTIIGWSLVMLVNALGLSAINEWFDRPVPEFVEHAYSSAWNLPLFWVAIALCAPLSEEVFFRGFLFRGFAASRLGTFGTVFLTSVLFTLLHVGQYGWIDLAQVGWVGLLLGLARTTTSSVLPPLFMHITLNLTALFLYQLTAAIP